MTGHDHETDRERVHQQAQFTDFAHDVEDNHAGGGWLNNLLRATVGVTPVGQALDTRRSDFESDDIRLNTLLDMVEQTDPADLESSGTALWNARDAIKKAASELDGHVTRVHWVGESGDSFREFGKDLVAYGEQLSTFAGSAGDQLSAASMGLASVRGAMPERDTRPADKQGMLPKDYPAHKKVDSDPDYAAAVKVEKNRQEAINQMNRLSSYYAVSTKQLNTLNANPPKLRTMPDVGVPKPKIARRWGETTGGGSGVGAAGASNSDGQVTERARPQIDGAHESGGAHVVAPPTVDAPPVKEVDGSITNPDRPVGTEIDSVGTLPSPTATPPSTGPAPVSGGPNPTAPTSPSFSNGYVPPMQGGMNSRTTGPAGSRAPFLPQGRSAGAPGTADAGTTRSGGRGGAGEMGRAGSTAKAGGPGGRTLPGAGGQGITGGSPRATGGQMPRTAGGTGAGRSNGVVGGRPTASPTGQSGSRIPRGSVMGVEGAAGNGRSSAGRVGQRGVIGAPGSAAGPAGRNASGPRNGAAASEAVTGNPTSRGSATRAERNGMTRGGTGLVRGPGRNGEPREEETEAAERPDYVVEDVNTHLPANRRDVPPVVN
ncbi:hypothetical protein ACIRF8_26025 [Streptomyces sp. NPDC102406]|uniref:hypothetical protein n=1 Tax=Streptomyces sp. NPDC102406 TaxID=3366171 RepID=UPI0037FEE1D7